MSADTPQATNPTSTAAMPAAAPAMRAACGRHSKLERNLGAAEMRLCLRFRRFRNLFTIRPQVRNERTRALWGLANPRRVTRAVCGLRAVQPRPFAPHGQLMNRLHALPGAAGQRRRIGRKVWPPLAAQLRSRRPNFASKSTLSPGCTCVMQASQKEGWQLCLD